MPTVGAREANRSFSKILKEAENGETVTITRNGKPVATLMPIQPLKPPKQSKGATEKFLKLLRKGFDLGGKGFSRDEMNER